MIEGLSGQCRRECSRPRTIELGSQGNDHAGRQVVRKTRHRRWAGVFAANFFDPDFDRATLPGIGGSGVYKDDGVHLADPFCQLWSELVQAQNFNLAGRKLGFQRIGHAPGKAVIRAQGIPIGNDEQADSPSLRRRRQARIVSTGQGACAITWCAVDHGRCVVPTSTEFRAPSTIRSASRSPASLRMHSLAEPNSSKVSGA